MCSVALGSNISVTASFVRRCASLVPASGFRDSTLPAGAMIREGWVVLTHLRPETKALVLWHNESRAEMGGCHAPVGR